MTVAFSSIILLDNVAIELKVRTTLILCALNERHVHGRMQICQIRKPMQMYFFLPLSDFTASSS
jgi:hypothetical protein